MGKTVPPASSFGDRWRIADCCKDGGQPERRGDVPDDGTAYGKSGGPLRASILDVFRATGGYSKDLQFLPVCWNNAI